MTETNKQEACQTEKALKEAQARIAEFMRGKRGRVAHFFNKYYTGDGPSYRTVVRVLFEGVEDYHGVWENAAEYYDEEFSKEKESKHSIIEKTK